MLGSTPDLACISLMVGDLRDSENDKLPHFGNSVRELP
jgi:hypothetical protein